MEKQEKYYYFLVEKNSLISSYEETNSTEIYLLTQHVSWYMIPWLVSNKQTNNNMKGIFTDTWEVRLSVIHKNKALLLRIHDNQNISNISQTKQSWRLSWIRRPTGDQEVAGSTPAEVGNILSWRLIMKYFLGSFSPFRWFKKGSCQFLAKECAQYWLTA